MKIIITNESITPAWFKPVLFFFFSVGLLTLFPFSETYLEESTWFKYSKNFLADYLPVINKPSRLSNFPNANALYLMTMFIAIIISVIYIFFQDNLFQEDGVRRLNIFKSFLGFVFLISMSFAIIYFRFVVGMPIDPGRSAGRGYILVLLLNGSRLSMALFSAITFWVAIFFFYGSISLLAALYAKYFILGGGE